MDIKSVIMLAFQVSIIATVFGYGLKATPEHVLSLLRRPGLLARSILAMFVCVPVVALALAHAFGLQPTIAVALIALAIAPLPPLMPKSLTAKLTATTGPAPYAVALMTTVGILSVLLVPLLVVLLDRIFGRPTGTSPLNAAVMAAALVLLPLVAGIVLRMLRPALADRIEIAASIAGQLLLRLAALLLLFTDFSAILALLGSSAISAIVILVVAGFAAGHLLGSPDLDDQAVLAIASGTRHPAIALAIAAAAAPDSQFGATILLYLAVSAIVGVPYTIWRRRVAVDAEAAAILLNARKQTVDDIQAGAAAPYYFVPPAPSSPGGDAPVGKAGRHEAG